MKIENTPDHAACMIRGVFYPYGSQPRFGGCGVQKQGQRQQVRTAAGAQMPGDEIVVQSLQRRSQSIFRQSEKCRRRLLHIAQALRAAAIDQGAVVQPLH